MDGYFPLPAHLAQNGYRLNLSVGGEDFQKGKPVFPVRVFSRERQSTATPLLPCLNGDNDAIDNTPVFETHNKQGKQAAPIHYLIK